MPVGKQFVCKDMMIVAAPKAAVRSQVAVAWAPTWYGLRVQAWYAQLYGCKQSKARSTRPLSAQQLVKQRCLESKPAVRAASSSGKSVGDQRRAIRDAHTRCVEAFKDGKRESDVGRIDEPAAMEPTSLSAMIDEIDAVTTARIDNAAEKSKDKKKEKKEKEKEKKEMEKKEKKNKEKEKKEKEKKEKVSRKRVCVCVCVCVCVYVCV